MSDEPQIPQVQRSRSVKVVTPSGVVELSASSIEIGLPEGTITIDLSLDLPLIAHKIGISADSQNLLVVGPGDASSVLVSIAQEGTPWIRSK